MTHLLDTDHVSILQEPNGADYAVVLANSARHRDEDVGISVVSFQEQALGWNSFIAKARAAAYLLKGYRRMYGMLANFRTFPLVPFDAAALSAYDAIKGSTPRVRTMDRRIAAVALANSLILVTRNARDFVQVPGLVTEDWTK